MLERIKFAAIFTSNLDEFFMVRVGSLSDLALLEGAHIDNKSGKTPSEQLSSIFKAVVPLYKQRDKVVEQLEGRLRTCNICRMSMGELDNKAKKQVEAWFKDEILPVLSPQVVDLHHPFPHLPNKNLNIALSLRMGGGKDLFGIIPLPQDLAPVLPAQRAQRIHYVLLEDVLLEYADRVFDRFAITDKAVVAVTRNADISPEDEAFDYDEDFRKLMQKVIKKRGRAGPGAPGSAGGQQGG